jgi:glutamate-1-semialdehyde 2,1-aminomutase
MKTERGICAAVIQARMASTRLPGKVLADLAGRPVIDWVVQAARKIVGVDMVVVATSDEVSDDPIADWCRGSAVVCVRGSRSDVLDRFRAAAEHTNADIVLRLTADCPLLDPRLCGEVLALLRCDLDYATNCEPQTYPDGLDCEAFTRDALDRALAQAELDSDREHVTQVFRRLPDDFAQDCATSSVPGVAMHRWTLDTPQDLDYLRQLIVLGDLEPGGDWLKALAVADRFPHPAPDAYNVALTAQQLQERQAPARRNAPRYSRSTAMLKKALTRIPVAAQTFSKSHLQFPVGGAPLFLSKGNGARVWDIDGHSYIDLVSGLLPVILGYVDPDVDRAIERQLRRGISHSLPTRLEFDLAERLAHYIPCAEQTRFGKNGTDATSAAIRIARAATGRDHVIACGYHGWQDWYIGSTARHLGVPQAVRELTHAAPFNSIAALEELFGTHRGEIAAVILEPASFALPEPGYLEKVAQLTRSHGAILIFDEVITGFRFSMGGAQAHYGVTPDLAAFGKAMGNGMPISAVVGRRDLMRWMEDIFFSGTFGGEALSLAASIATIDKLAAIRGPEQLWKNGAKLAAEVQQAFNESPLRDNVVIGGADPWRILAFKPRPEASVDELKTAFISGMARRGVLVNSSHNISCAHDEATMSEIVAAYRGTLQEMAELCERAAGLGHSLASVMDCPIVEPVFKIRQTT